MNSRQTTPALDPSLAAAIDAPETGTPAAGEALIDEERDDESRLLPFSFAKRHGLLVTGFDDGKAQTLVRDDAVPNSISEVRRFVRRPLQMKIVTPEDFDIQLQQIYEQESNSTMQMVDGFGDDDDLMRAAQELPEPSDLLESDDDAPIIRLINAVLTSAVKENASDIHVEPFENRLVVRFPRGRGAA